MIPAPTPVPLKAPPAVSVPPPATEPNGTARSAASDRAGAITLRGLTAAAERDRLLSSASAAEERPLLVGTPRDHFRLSLQHMCQAVCLACRRKPPPPAKLPNLPPKTTHADELGHAEGYHPTGHAAMSFDQADNAHETGIFLPTDHWKGNWDLLVFVYVLFSAVYVPFQVSFDFQAAGALWWFEQLVVFTFLADAALHFNTAFIEHEHAAASSEWVTSRTRIGARYLSGWFWVDVPSAVPLELIDWATGSSGQWNYLLLHLRLLRLLRLAQTTEFLHKVEARFDINLTVLHTVMMVAKLLYLAHLLGCFWFAIASVSTSYFGHETSWLTEYRGGAALETTLLGQYIEIIADFASRRGLHSISARFEVYIVSRRGFD